jgi:hypothetical protein
MTQTPSTNQEVDRFQAILETRIAEFERGIRQRDGVAIEQSADQVEGIQRASERDLAISNIDGGSRQLREARAALAASMKTPSECASNQAEWAQGAVLSKSCQA